MCPIMKTIGWVYCIELLHLIQWPTCWRWNWLHWNYDSINMLRCKQKLKFVPKLLSVEQKEICFWHCTRYAGVCQWLSSECWYTDKTQKPRFSLHRGSHHHPQGQRKQGRWWESVSVADWFFYYCRVVHYEYELEGQTFNKQYYVEVLHHLHDWIQCKRHDLWESR